MTNNKEIFVSVDVETAGPIPAKYSLLSIGACLAFEPERTFTCTLKPINRNADPKALEVSGMTLEGLEVSGLDPAQAMSDFTTWLKSVCSPEQTLVFVGFNTPFDWSFINYYFHRFTGANPFGFSALDIKALYMGATGSAWSDTRSSRIASHLKPELRGDHDALHDAQYQAELFRLIYALLKNSESRDR